MGYNDGRKRKDRFGINRNTQKLTTFSDGALLHTSRKSLPFRTDRYCIPGGKAYTSAESAIDCTPAGKARRKYKGPFVNSHEHVRTSKPS